MSLIHSLLEYFSKPKEEVEGTTPEGLCPNCWGRQEYDNVIREMYMDKQIDVNNHKAHYAFVQDYIVNHVNGIKLIKGTSSYECPTCKVKYDQ